MAGLWWASLATPPSSKRRSGRSVAWQCLVTFASPRSLLGLGTVPSSSASCARWVNNAAVVHLSPLHLMAPEVIDEVLDINLRAVVMGTREALGSFLAHSVPGSIVNLSSIHGRAGVPRLRGL